ncbi:hypothetical protein BDN72DRAFT_92611 [Pluteus cervinus]|uniref:Uncharacterized protein n=1 Tax=Pluteus cervinus TaxID=181527 RepID=A0ACD2ZYF0_9AGAR|nr:hypothetical protein BDN72DRAFT_92611 [Pluteus cervinus]
MIISGSNYLPYSRRAFRSAYNSLNEEVKAAEVPQVRNMKAEPHTNQFSNLPVTAVGQNLQSEVEKRIYAFQLAFTIAYKNQDSAPEPKQDAYPKVRFWFWSIYADWKRDVPKDSDEVNALIALGLSEKYWFFEDIEGRPLPPQLITRIRSRLAAIFLVLLKRIPEILPESWHKADPELRKLTCLEIEIVVPALAYSDNHWKSNAIATVWYPDWKKNTVLGKKGPAAIKAESESSGGEMSTRGERKRDDVEDNEDRTAKRQKVDATKPITKKMPVATRIL